MSRSRLLFLFLVPFALQGSSVLMGTQPFTQQLTDQSGAPWGTETLNVGTTGDYFPYPLPAGTLGAISGSAFTTLGDAAYLHPGAGPIPDVSFTETLAIDPSVTTINLYVYAFGQSDECVGCEPTLAIDLPGERLVTDHMYTIFTELSNPGSITFFGDVSSMLPDCYDSLAFGVAYTDPPVAIPEPGARPLLGIGLVLLAIKKARIPIAAKRGVRA